MDYVELYKKYCSGICFIESRSFMDSKGGMAGDGILGTGFLIEKQSDISGLFVTAKHVIENTAIGDIEIRFNYAQGANGPICGMGIMNIEKIWRHSTHDVALIQACSCGERLVKYYDNHEKKECIKDVGADLSKHDVLPLDKEDNILVGEQVVIIGYPEGKNYVFIDDILGAGSAKNLVPVMKHGIIAQKIPADCRPTEVFLYDIETAPGFSGSPIIKKSKNNSIKVAGVHTNGSETKDIGYAHVVRYVRELLEEYK